jgi:PIN domain nuclease of toxin-antitoxin system
MNYLLDTHTFIWSIVNTEKMSAPIKKILEDGRNNVYVSVVSFWELSIKYSLGKIQLSGVQPEDFTTLADKCNFSILQLKSVDAASGHQLPWVEKHRDPFDRILIWQAIKNDFTFLSRDKDIESYREVGLKLIW